MPHTQTFLFLTPHLHPKQANKNHLPTNNKPISSKQNKCKGNSEKLPEAHRNMYAVIQDTEPQCSEKNTHCSASPRTKNGTCFAFMQPECIPVTTLSSKRAVLCQKLTEVYFREETTQRNNPWS